MTMSSNRTACILTAALLAAIAGLALAPGIRLPLLRRPAPSEPQDSIYAMLNAARAGDVKGYMGAYTGSMEASLRETIAESSEPAFAQYLKSSAATIKGVALSDRENISESAAKVRVEYVYEDRNEVQTIYLERRPEGWKIARTDTSERIPTLTPYGTPVK